MRSVLSIIRSLKKELEEIEECYSTMRLGKEVKQVSHFILVSNRIDYEPVLLFHISVEHNSFISPKSTDISDLPGMSILLGNSAHQSA